MFMNCRNALHTIPQFSGTTVLSDGCFNRMFEGCETLTLNGLYINLPSDKLAPGCCSRMFADCISLDISPILCPEHTAELVENCFSQMFYGCTNLTRITMFGVVKGWNSNPYQYLNEWAVGVGEYGELVVSSEGSVYQMIGSNRDYTIWPENWDLSDH
jgi:hypothetical protein